MKVSIITVVFNRHETICESMRSVQRQTWNDVEHIIQDGGSTDGTVELVRSLADERTRLVTEPDAGIYDAINKAIARSTGDVIGLMHSDDFYSHDRVVEQVAEILRDGAADGVYGDLMYVSAKQPEKVIRYWKSGTFRPQALEQGWMPPHPTVFLRREVFTKWGLYDTRFRIAADYEAILRYLVRGNISLAYIPEVLVKMRVGGESNRSAAHILRKSREDLAAIRQNGVGGFGTLTLKNLRKIHQFWIRDRGIT